MGNVLIGGNRYEGDSKLENNMYKDRPAWVIKIFHLSGEQGNCRKLRSKAAVMGIKW